MANDISMNSVLVSSYHYADLVESDAAMHALRNHILSHLSVYKSYDGEPRVGFEADGLLVLFKALFPEHYLEREKELIEQYLKDHPDGDD